MAYESKRVSRQVTKPYNPIVVNYVSKMSQQPKQRSKPLKQRSKPVKQARPIKSKKSPEKSHTSVKIKKVKTAKVNSSKPQPEKNVNKNNDLIKESVKSLKTLGYKSGEVKKTLQNLCISNEFKNSESLIEAFFKSR
jgi:Holliday junction resolvasome RuvABC DNA-binding subunit